MSSLAIYECNILRNQNKAGRLKTDANGYREITLGAFDCVNSGGEFYDFTAGIKAMFENGGALQRRIVNGNLRGEVEHPVPQPGETMASFMNRVRQILMDKVGHHIKQVRLQPGKDHNGNAVVLCIGLVKGSGPFGAQLDARFDNPDENVDFSIRSLTKAYNKGLQRHKIITTIVTWDQVNEGGIRVANKYDTPSMENISEGGIILDSAGHTPIEFSELTLRKADSLALEAKAMGFESAETIDSTLIRDDFGWNKVQLISPRSSVNW